MEIFNIVDKDSCKLCVKVNDDNTITITEINSYVDAEDYEYKNIQIGIIKQINYTNEMVIKYKRHTVLFIILAALSLLISLIYSIAASFGNFELIITIVLLVITAFFVLLSFIQFPYKTNTTCFSIDTENDINLYSSYNKEFDLDEIIHFTEYINSLKI